MIGLDVEHRPFSPESSFAASWDPWAVNENKKRSRDGKHRLQRLQNGRITDSQLIGFFSRIFKDVFVGLYGHTRFTENENGLQLWDTKRSNEQRGGYSSRVCIQKAGFTVHLETQTVMQAEARRSEGRTNDGRAWLCYGEKYGRHKSQLYYFREPLIAWQGDENQVKTIAQLNKKINKTWIYENGHGQNQIKMVLIPWYKSFNHDTGLQTRSKSDKQLINRL